MFYLIPLIYVPSYVDLGTDLVKVKEQADLFLF